MPEKLDTIERLHAQSERVQIDFVRADLDVASTFVEMARFELSTGNTEHAAALLAKARHAAEVLAEMIGKAPTREQAQLNVKREKLLDAIREVEAALRKALGSAAS